MPDANCLGVTYWDNAITFSTTLASGQCGLSDGSKAGDWRLPTVVEFQSIVDAGYGNTTPRAAGFSNIQPDFYWSQISGDCGLNAWAALMPDAALSFNSKGDTGHVWPVR